MYKIPVIDIKILERFFPGHKYQKYDSSDNNKVRGYKIDDKDISLMIIEKETIRVAVWCFWMVCVNSYNIMDIRSLS